MKQVFSMLLAIAVLTALAGCSSSDDNTTNPTGSAGSMAATVDGTAWTSSMVTQATSSNGAVAFAGRDNNNRQINIAIVGATAAGTYKLGDLMQNVGSSAILALGTSQTDVYSTFPGLATGTITFSTLTTTGAEGTFSFTGRNTAGATKSVTNGTFKVTF